VNNIVRFAGVAPDRVVLQRPLESSRFLRGGAAKAADSRAKQVFNLYA